MKEAMRLPFRLPAETRARTPRYALARRRSASACLLLAAGRALPRLINYNGSMERRGGGSGRGGASYESYMEQENDASINHLASKVSALRDISIQIGGHIKEDNRLLDDMGGSFDRTSGMLGGTMKRLSTLANSSGGGYMIYLAVFVVFIFLLMWRLAK